MKFCRQNKATKLQGIKNYLKIPSFSLRKRNMKIIFSIFYKLILSAIIATDFVFDLFFKSNITFAWKNLLLVNIETTAIAFPKIFLWRYFFKILTKIHNLKHLQSIEIQSRSWGLGSCIQTIKNETNVTQVI